MWICEKGGNCVDPCDERCGHYLEVEPVVHGRWIRAAAYNDGVLNTAYCSVCRNFLPAYNWDYHNYCPNCGARMDGE